MKISYRLFMWSQYSHDRNYPYDFVRTCSTKSSLIQLVRSFFLKKEILVLFKEPVLYFRLEIFVDNNSESISLTTRYRSLTRFRALLDFYLEKAIENHNLPF